MKVLNLYAGIGGNRKLWPKDCEVTAVEWDKDTANEYKKNFPKDNVIVGDAHKFLLEHYKEFDFIWCSPPCPTHSRFRFLLNNVEKYETKYPDMALYQEILLLKHFFKGKWVVENVISYYDPLILPFKVSNHYFWANFNITKFEKVQREIRNDKEINVKWGFDLGKSKYKLAKRRKMINNLVFPKLGLHVFNCAFKEKQGDLNSW